jgi:hypothetical protein
MPKPNLRLCLVVAVALLACDGSGSSGGTPTLPGNTGSASEFCDAFLQAAVSLLSQCYGGGQSYWTDLYAQILDCPEVARLVAAGTLVYDANQGKQCLDAVRTYDCTDTGPIPACNAAVTGKVPSGGTCAARTLMMFNDCAPGNDCVWRSDSCGGTCRPYARVGEACGYAVGDDYIDCEDGASCGWDTEVCIADAAEGQPCGGTDAVACASGLYCEGGDYSTSGICHKQKTSGSCASDDECANTYVCLGNGDAGSCRKVKLPGEACVPGECMPFFAWCGADGQCTDVRATENQSCGGASGDYIQCASGLYCDYSSTSQTGTCRRQTAAGSVCTTTTVCAGNGYCDTATGLCVSCS